MKRCRNCFVLVLAALALLPSLARAQATKPVAVISINNIDEILGDVGFLTELAGAEALGPLVKSMSGPFLAGIDTSKPIGATVYFNAQTQAPEVLAFVPVKDIKQVINLAKNAGGLPIEDKGNGSYEVSAGFQTVYIKEKSGWAFIGISEEALAAAPADPIKLLGKLPSTYDLAVQGNIANVPPIFKGMAIDQIKAGAEAAAFQQPGESEEAFKIRTNVMKAQMAQVEEIINSMNTMTIGWAIDQKSKEVYLDFGMTAVSGSELAKEISSMKNMTSSFAGFLADDAAMTANIAMKVAESDIAQLDALVKVGKQQALAEIEKDSSIDAAVKTKVKGIVESVIEVFATTVKGGKIDGGATLELKPDAMAFAAGMLIVDAKKLDKAFKELVDLAKDEPDFPKVEMSAAKHAGVDLHRISVPVPDEDARPFFGDNVEILIGTGDKAAYIAFGKNSLDLLKKAIDGSSADKTVSPLQVNLALGPILSFAQAIENNGDETMKKMIEVLQNEKGTDRLRMTATSDGDNGVRYRILVEEGILKAVGAAAQGGGGF